MTSVRKSKPEGVFEFLQTGIVDDTMSFILDSYSHLSERKAELKERMISIMNYKKKSTLALILTFILTLLLTGCANTEQRSKNNEKAYYGKWVVQKVLAYGQAGTYSRDDAETLIGKSLDFSAGAATIITDQSSEPVVNMSNPEYQESVVSGSDFQTDFGMSFVELGISENSITAVEVADSDGTGGTFLIKDSNTIIFVAGGTYFELTRK